MAAMHKTKAPIVAGHSIEAVQAVVIEAGEQQACLLARSGGSKPALSTAPEGTLTLDLSQLSGMIEYEPGEFVFTAYAGTPLATVAAELARHGQYLPFDPPLAEQGATLGGTIAAGLSGSGRQRYGGLRDFLIGARYVDGQGRLIRSGGKVVKNAAGFDQHKLLIGSIGRLGILVEVSFKVFPQPPAYATLRIPLDSTEAAAKLLARLATAKFDLEALDVVYGDGAAAEAEVLIRLGGLPTVLPERLAAVERWLGAGTALAGVEEHAHWSAAARFAWLPPGWMLVKTPITLARLRNLDRALRKAGARRRYIAGGNLAWIGWPGKFDDLNALLLEQGLAGLALAPVSASPILGAAGSLSLAQRFKQTLDPFGVFPALPREP